MNDFDVAPYIEQYQSFLKLCESPIERIMCHHLHKSWFSTDTIQRFTPQQKINCGGKEYRADFVVESLDLTLGKPFFVAIECDGHDFHDKTKEQAQRDKQRDRDFQRSGYFIMRFTGAEIVGDCERCVREIESFLESKRRYVA